MTTKSQYLGGYIVKPSNQLAWIQVKVQKWADGATEIAKLAVTHPQQAYVAFTKSFQMEWLYLQRVTEKSRPYMPT